MPSLTAYEQEQVLEIAGWKAEPPALVAEVMDALTHPLAKLTEQFIPERAVKDAVEVAYQDSEILAHREDVAQRAQVADVRELRKGDLAQCDRLAEEFARIATRDATMRGATMAAGPLLGMELSVMYALKTVHTIGYCYGFTPEEPREREYALRALLVASARSLKEKQQATVNLRSVEEDLVEEIAEEFVEEAAEAAVEQVAEEAIGSSIPLLGLAIGGLTNTAVTYHMSHVAKRLFQERWLRTNGKVDKIAPEPRLARSRLQRAESVLAACCYWPSYVVSFAVTFPALLVTSVLPKQNIAVQGFAHGAAAASRDVREFQDGFREATSPRRQAAAQPAAVPAPA